MQDVRVATQSLLREDSRQRRLVVDKNNKVTVGLFNVSFVCLKSPCQQHCLNNSERVFSPHSICGLTSVSQRKCEMKKFVKQSAAAFTAEEETRKTPFIPLHVL
ncbi:hypothetical protein JOB18_017052 [Solea senegalensis]|uniref:Uncharacterized protein n=1 Tax=Solea senegalensis TaxID=28829 RepID=A0AAV6Q2P4_SOLSE|nr:hypothetical protein JOB18_017052 [Solea senegalensis]